MNRDVFLLEATSGWRIERPSGAAIIRELSDRKAAEIWLAANGYEFKSVIGKSEHWHAKS